MAITLNTLEERDVRQFYLINDVEEVFDLTSYLPDEFEPFVGFLHQPSGLGYASENTYQTLFHYDVMTDKEWINNDIQGELIFKSYEQYTSFTYFVSHTKSLYLAYVLPYESNIVGLPSRPRVYAQCDIDLLEKSEKDSDNGLLLCNINFHILEPFKSEKIIRQGITIEPSANTKTYDVNYDKEDTTSYIYGNASGQYIIINNVGTAYTFPKITIKGASTNPTISVSNYNTGEVLQALAFELSLTETDTLVIYGDPLNQYITLNGENAYDFINKDLDTYIVLPSGKSILTLDATGGSMEVEYEYKFYTI